jgi:hypothetical protein
LTTKIALQKDGRFFGFVNGKVVVRSRNEAYVKAKVAAAGGNLEVKKDAPKISFSVSERFDFIEQFVNLIARRKMNSLILVGSGGIGKTHSVLTALKKNGMKEMSLESDGDFVVVKGFSTPKYLFRTLWENNGKTIIYDDADSAFKDPISANLLKAALEDSPKRVITWGAEWSDKEEMPNRFQFTGRVIFISNLSIEQFPQAIISRSAKVNLQLSVDETVERIEQVFNQISGTPEEKKEVVAFIRKYADVASDLNIRSALNVLQMRRNLGSNWERMALYQWAN